MHNCTNCAHEAAFGIEALNVCTNCGAVAASSASIASVVVFVAAAAAAVYLATKFVKAALSVRVVQPA